MTTALVILLALSSPLRAPDVQVAAQSATGADLPELADAVARALVASGARVVLGGPASERCARCAQVTVTETGKGRCTIAITYDKHTTHAALKLTPDSALFDRARAVAIHVRLLMPVEAHAEPRQGQARSSKAATNPVLPEPAESSPRNEGSGGSRVASLGIPAAAAPVRATAMASLSPSPASSVAPPAPSARAERPGPEDAAPEQPERAPARLEEPARRSQDGERRQSDELVVAQPKAPAKAGRWPWIPTVVGAGAAVGAGVFAYVAKDRYDALSDRSMPLSRAQELKSRGETFQTTALVLSGIALVGLGTGVIGFLTQEPEPLITAVVLPTSGGGMLALKGGLP